MQLPFSVHLSNTDKECLVLKTFGVNALVNVLFMSHSELDSQGINL